MSLCLQVIPDDVVGNILKTCSSNSYEQLEEAVKELLREGYAAVQVISQVSVKNWNFSAMQKERKLRNM